MVPYCSEFCRMYQCTVPYCTPVNLIATGGAKNLGAKNTSHAKDVLYDAHEYYLFRDIFYVRNS